MTVNTLFHKYTIYFLKCRGRWPVGATRKHTHIQAYTAHSFPWLLDQVTVINNHTIGSADCLSIQVSCDACKGCAPAAGRNASSMLTGTLPYHTLRTIPYVDVDDPTS